MTYEEIKTNIYKYMNHEIERLSTVELNTILKIIEKEVTYMCYDEKIKSFRCSKCDDFPLKLTMNFCPYCGREIDKTDIMKYNEYMKKALNEMNGIIKKQ